MFDVKSTNAMFDVKSSTTMFDFNKLDNSWMQEHDMFYCKSICILIYI